MHFDHEVHTGSGLCGSLFLFFCPMANTGLPVRSRRIANCRMCCVFGFYGDMCEAQFWAYVYNSVYNFDFSSVGIIINISQLILNSEIIAVCSKIHTKHINTLRGQNVYLLSVKSGDT